MKIIFIKFLSIVFLIFLIFSPNYVSAFSGKVKEGFPRVANYYLRWDITDLEAEKLAKWDVLVLDMEVQHNSASSINKIRQINPDIIILSYITSQEIKTDLWDENYCSLRYQILDSIDYSWWLKDTNDNNISFWPGTNMLNLNSSWNQFLPKFTYNSLMKTGAWDGVFFDNIWPDVSWVNGGNIDIDKNGSKDSSSVIDSKWMAGNVSMLSLANQLYGNDFLITANSRYNDTYQPYLNGIMLESFPSPWEDDGTWAGSMKSYTTDSKFRSPQVSIVNSNMNNVNNMSDYRRMRFGLGSTLLGDGYYSFDYGVNEHSQTWWYDEYDTNLGKALSDPYNLLDKNNSKWKAGIWRRDFENGIVIVNSTKENQAYVFDDEVFEKINGTQDRRINNGSKINMVAMMGQDAVVMYRTVDFNSGITPEDNNDESPSASVSNIVKNNGFNNGAFVRVFNESGKQVRNGFFTYRDEYPPSSQVLISDIDSDGVEETLVNYKGVITIYKNNSIVSRFQPYEGKFKGEISFAVADLDGDAVSEIITGAGAGGGPHVRVFNKDGKPLIGGFFAYDKNFRGGVNVAVMDLNGDGTKEIITGAGIGGGPHIRIFSKDGAPLTGGFFAFDQSSRSGARIAIGNVDGQGEKEIIVGSGPGNAPMVRVFNKDGKMRNEFNAYDLDMRDGIMVITADLDKDGKEEILAGSLSY